MTTRWRTVRNSPLRTRLAAVLVVAAFSGVVATSALSQTGSKLIGKLEGPEIVTDASKFPKAFKEAPQLAELVKAGKLPPVAERIGQDPLVIKPLKEIGKYGGAWRRASPAPRTSGTASAAARARTICCSGTTRATRPCPISRRTSRCRTAGARLVHLRRGMKWSDGKPFTADDFMFWFEDIYQNKDLVPTPTAAMAINGKQGVIEKVDTTPCGSSSRSPTSCSPTCWRARRISPAIGGAYRGMGGFAPRTT